MSRTQVDAGIIIRSLEATAGYLGAAGKIELAPGLNFILGPKGSFKSTIVELLRVTLGVDEARIQGLLTPDGRITRALDGGTARVELEVDGTKVSATRDVDSGVKLSRKAKLEGIEVFSQGDIRTLSEERERRLELVDQAHRARKLELLGRRDELAARAASLGQRLLPLIREIREREEDERAGAEGRAKLEALAADPSRAKSPPELQAAREAFEKRQGLLARSQELLRVRDDMIQALHELCERGRGLKSTADALARYGEEHAIVAANDVAEMLRRAAETFQKAEAWCRKETPAELAYEKLEAAFQEQDRPYARLLEQEKGHRAAIEEENALRAVVAKADRAKADLAAFRKSEAKLREDRSKLYIEVDKIDDELRALRQKRVRELEKISEHTAVSLHVGADTAAYRDALETLLKSALATLRDAVVAHLPPRKLIELVESRNVEALVGLRARSNDAVRFLDRLETSTELHRTLENVVLGDEIEITFKDGNVEKPIENLSEGQRATALLPVLLQADRAAPIIIDEPETHLDNRFIAGTLVDQLKKLKKHRQVIVVTHNPNLVALADPDHLIIMDAAGPSQAAKPVMGSFKLTRDEVVKIVEGGVRAFREREKRYGLPTLAELDR